MDCAHNVGVLVDELEEALQAPEEAFAATHDAARERVVKLLQLVVDVLKDDADYADYGDDERAEGDRA